MSFSFKDVFKNRTKEQVMDDLKEDLLTIKENVYYSQKMFKIGTWTYILADKKIFLSDEVYEIYESDYNLLEDSVDGFNLYFHPDDREEVFEHIRGLSNGKSYDIEFRIITKKGAIKFIKERTTIIYDADGNAKRVVGIIQDVTDQRIMEADLNVINNSIIDNERIEGVGYWKYEVEDNKYYWSDEVYRIHGIKPAEFKNDYRNFFKFVHKDDITYLEEVVKNLLNGKPLRAEYRVTQSDGTIRHFKAVGNPRFNKMGEVKELLGTISDVSEKENLNKIIENKDKEIKNIERRFTNIIKESKEGYEIVDNNGIIRYSSDSVRRIVGYTREEVVNTTIYKYFSGEDLEIIKNMIRYVSINPSKNIESELSLKNTRGEEMFLEVFMTNKCCEPSIGGIIINYRDITDKVKAKKQLIYDANYDKLTGLKSRSYFLEGLKELEEKAKESNEKYVLFMMEIDGLKDINFSLGHKIGDKLILKIVERFRTICSDDNEIGRYSEDNFAIMAKVRSDESEYEILIEEFISLFSKPFKVDSYELIVGINIGMCIFPKIKKDNLPINNSAKVALIRSKRDGKNNYEIYSQELNIKYYKELALRSDLTSAIKKDQLEVYYQPFINIKSNEILGAEALIRWNHPEWGLVPPGEFIAIAEETGLIIDIGKWVLREVCKNYKKWINKGLKDIKVSVNFSGIQFFEKDFVEKIKEIIEDYKLKPEFLIMEITENILLKNIEKVTQDLKELQLAGIKIALDDFGTGFSSLSYLGKLNIDILKLDRSFIKGIPADTTNSIITRTTLKLAKELKIKLIAEGIETWDQLSYLKGLNCSIGQGYIYSRPLPLEDFEVLLAKKKCKPVIVNIGMSMPDKDRRKFFRVNFLNLLEADLTILEIGGKTVNVGNTKVLIKNIGPGGLCFISNIRFPIEKAIILRFTTNLVEEDIVVYGNPVWSEELELYEDELNDKMYEYGIEFRIDENDREGLVKILNAVQIKMRNNILFAEGTFISGPYNKYFK